jgi:hypothetical protein
MSSSQATHALIRVARLAYVCPKCEKNGSPRRIFSHPGQPKPKCPEHGAVMVIQPNNPYFGRPT